MALLFSYGTLQDARVQRVNFGRVLEGVADILPAYIVAQITIHDPRVLQQSGQAQHPILQYSGNQNDEVAGTVFELSEQELAQADDYEVAAYCRVSAKLKSGRKCWIYAAATVQT